ncbi:hypothetical protein TpMuguga_03g00018 [Theileria parva strain Muguga]|uniref:uncharacterized protein n=1 Tax=Theileria parva strain Muguga TaxID=333668 RepID=UPI001C6217AF|nr:uncharacterized protein TpMuguga_03g00018 [Theileria parva strain Muguga]EAN30754.2 hypothetical protein TpMuguga_03g00018 [Theileria parva strain Muguga]
MSRKNSKVSAKRRMNVIKTEYMINNRKKEQRREVKKLQNHVKAQLLKLSISHNQKDGLGEIEMAGSKLKNPGVNFSRSVDSSRPLRARDKKILQATLKRKRKLQLNQLN